MQMHWQAPPRTGPPQFAIRQHLHLHPQTSNSHPSGAGADPSLPHPLRWWHAGILPQQHGDLGREPSGTPAASRAAYAASGETGLKVARPVAGFLESKLMMKRPVLAQGVQPKKLAAQQRQHSPMPFKLRAEAEDARRAAVAACQPRAPQATQDNRAVCPLAEKAECTTGAEGEAAAVAARQPQTSRPHKAVGSMLISKKCVGCATGAEEGSRGSGSTSTAGLQALQSSWAACPFVRPHAIVSPTPPHHTAVGHMPPYRHTYAQWLAPASGCTLDIGLLDTVGW